MSDIPKFEDTIEDVPTWDATHPEDNSHDLIPFLSSAASGLVNGVSSTASGVYNAAMNPVDTAKKAGSWVADVATDPIGDIKGAYRAVRNIPIVGDMANDAVSGLAAAPARLKADANLIMGNDGPTGLEAYDKAKQEFLAKQAAEDAQHAEESPVANTVQRLAGTLNPLGMNVPANVMDTYYKSIKAGNSPEIAFKDARNALVLMKGPEMAVKGVGKVAKKLPAALTGVSDDTAKYYMQNVDAVDNARPLKDVSDDLSSSTKQFRRDMSNQSTEGFKALQDSGLVSTADDLTRPIEEQIQRIAPTAVTESAKSQVGQLANLKNSIAELAQGSEGALSLDKVKSVVRQLDDMIDWEAVDRGRGSSQDKALLSIRRQYDVMLKSSPEYSQVMEGLAAKSSALDDVSGSLKSDKSTDSFLNRLAKGKDPRGQEALQNLDSEMGTNFAKEIQDAGTKDFFTRENSRGSRNTLVAGAAGALLGGTLGLPPWVTAAAATTAGPVVDKFGRQIYQSILRAAAKNPQVIEAYAKSINAAGKAGSASLIALHNSLIKQDPDYAAAVSDQP